NSYAQVALERGNLPQARERYRDTLQVDPEDVYAKTGLAQVALGLGYLETAERQFEYLSNQYPEDVVIGRGYAQVAAVRRDYKDAIRRLSRISGRGDVDIPTLTRFADWHFQDGDRDGAERFLARARRVDPTHPWVLVTEGRFELVRGKLSEAGALARRALEV